MAALLAGNIAVPAFFRFAGLTVLPLAFIGAGVLFLPLFVFLQKIIRQAMKVDEDAVLSAFGRNEQTRKVFWLSRVRDPRQENAEGHQNHEGNQTRERRRMPFFDPKQENASARRDEAEGFDKSLFPKVFRLER